MLSTICLAFPQMWKRSWKWNNLTREKSHICESQREKRNRKCWRFPSLWVVLGQLKIQSLVLGELFAESCSLLVPSYLLLLDSYWILKFVYTLFHTVNKLLENYVLVQYVCFLLYLPIGFYSLNFRNKIIKYFSCIYSYVCLGADIFKEIFKFYS